MNDHLARCFNLNHSSPPGGRDSAGHEGVPRPLRRGHATFLWDVSRGVHDRTTTS